MAQTNAQVSQQIQDQHVRLTTTKQDIETYFSSREFRNHNNQEAQFKASVTWNALESVHRDTRGVPSPRNKTSGLLNQQWCHLDSKEWYKRFGYLVSVLEG